MLLLNKYRPITLNNSIKQIVKTCIYRIVKDEFREHLYKNQHGFQSKCSTISNLQELLNIVYNRLDKHLPTDIIYIDFSKSFDSIDQNFLIQKISHICQSHKILKIIHLLLSKNCQTVKIGNQISSKHPIPSDVSQGSILSPLLFVLYINDIFDLKLTSTIIGYADDIQLIGEPGAFLQSDIDAIYEWSSNNHMSINTKQCASIHFGIANPLTSYHINQDSIPNTTFFEI